MKTEASNAALKEGKESGKFKTHREWILCVMHSEGWVTAQAMLLRGMPEKTFSARISEICDDGLAKIGNDKNLSIYFPVDVNDSGMINKLRAERLENARQTALKRIKTLYTETELREMFK